MRIKITALFDAVVDFILRQGMLEDRPAAR